MAENRLITLRKSADEKEESDLSDYNLPYDFVDELEDMDPTERQFILDEPGAKQDLWDNESEVSF